jgi:excinuclease ABC subunit A
MVDQNALGKNQRSNPVTYVGAYDAIRELYSSLPAAKDRQLKPLHFSFNVVGGRCETCQGEGVVTVPMQFLPDIKLECETCHGKRFKQVVLEVAYGGVSVQGQEQAAHKGKNIHEVLQLTVESALEFFADKPKIASRLQKLMDVGLGYVRLGQSTATLSGGEAQRLKLASFLDRTDAKHAVYIFDEPTTGLHLHDIALLVGVLQRLVDQGHTVIVIEHHLDVIKSADWLIDLGPEGGSGGGELVYAGLPEGILSETRSHTARYLREKLVQ